MSQYREQDDATEDTGLVCGCRVQRDHSGGQGHCWRDVSADDLPASVRQEIEAEILDGGADRCDGYRATNGQYYRW